MTVKSLREEKATHFNYTHNKTPTSVCWVCCTRVRIFANQPFRVTPPEQSHIRIHTHKYRLWNRTCKCVVEQNNKKYKSNISISYKVHAPPNHINCTTHKAKLWLKRECPVSRKQIEASSTVYSTSSPSPTDKHPSSVVRGALISPYSV